MVSKEVVKNRNFNTINTKVNESEKKLPVASTLISKNQYKTDIENKILRVCYLVTTSVLNTKIGEMEKKIPAVSI